MMLSQGDRAPEISLFNDEYELFTLSDQLNRSNVLLLFFPGAFTGVCTTELNTVSNDLESYGKDTLVLGISTDSPFSLAEFKKVNGFRFSLLSDHNAEASPAYGCKYDHDFTAMRLDRISRRSAFVVDRYGVIRYAEVLENAGNIPDLEAIKNILSNL
jgi:peroxiredoxin